MDTNELLAKANELLDYYAKGERNFCGWDLTGVDLTGVDLTGSNLSESNFSPCDFSEIRLLNYAPDKSYFDWDYDDEKNYFVVQGEVRSNLSRINLSGANLSETNLFETNLSEANLIEASLNKANLKFADLTRAILRKADLSGACLGTAKLDFADLSQVNLNKGILNNATLPGANLSEASLIEADFRGANLINANLSRANLAYAQLSGANLSKADLSNANLASADLTDTDLSEAKLEGTILAYQKIVENLQRENHNLIGKIEFLQTKLSSNQGINACYTWAGFRFRSENEIKIAQALDGAGVLFYPNCKARLTTSKGKVNKETDFLVFHSGKWGILESDGRQWHQIAADDHERDRLFKRCGIRVIERFTATQCRNEPDKVVQEFLDILSQA